MIGRNMIFNELINYVPKSQYLNHGPGIKVKVGAYDVSCIVGVNVVDDNVLYRLTDIVLEVVEDITLVC